MGLEPTYSSLREKRICLCTTPAYIESTWSAQRESNPRDLESKSSTWPLGYTLKLVGLTDLNRLDVYSDVRAKTPRPI